MSSIWIVTDEPVVGITHYPGRVIGVFSTEKDAEHLSTFYPYSRVQEFTVSEPANIYETAGEMPTLNGN